jgi:NADH-quinone oxidoreductase subunit J
MSVLQVVFLVTGFVTLLAGVMVVASPKLIHAALWLIVSLAGVAVLFVLLNANFLAVVQVVVYIGAIAILIIFAVMLTRRVMTDSGPTHNPTWWLALVSALVLLGGLLALILQVPAFAQAGPTGLPPADSGLADLGTSLVDVNRFLLPFEVASVLLLAALIGAMAVARPAAKTEEEAE